MIHRGYPLSVTTLANLDFIGYNKDEIEKTEGRMCIPLLNEKMIKTLEFYKISEMLAAKAETTLGKGLVEQLAPSTELEEVKRRLRHTDEAYVTIRLKGSAPFGGIRDVRSSLQRARIASMLAADELLDIAETTRGARRLKAFISTVHDDASAAIPGLYEIARRIMDHKSVEEEIRACINDEGEVVDQASPDLARIRREIRGGESRIRERLETMIRSATIQKMLQEQLITLRNDRYVIPVKQEYRSHFGGMIHDQSSSGATLFIEPEAIVVQNNRLRELRFDEAKEIEKILRRLTERVAEAADTLEINLDALAELDFHFAKASLAYDMKAGRPRMNDRGYLRLARAHHPLIPAEHVVPIDVELGNEHTAIIITGPNTGGKTVTLKTIGLLSLMAMSGLFIPAADESQMCVFDAIYADIGDEQSIEQSLSTFSSHLTNIIGILRDMTPKSLVLLDELGAGTDPAEGSALAIALLEYIHGLGCRIVATTHYSELKAYAYERKGVINASMEFDVQTLSPTYRLLVGIPGRSNAFAIAERLGLPKAIIDQAKGQVNVEDQKVESMIASLEHNRKTAEAEREEAEQLRKEVERLRRKLAEEEERFAEQKNKLLMKAKQEAEEAVAKARREADQIIADLRKLALEEKASVKEHKLIEAKRRLEDAVPDLPVAGKAGQGRRGSSIAHVEPGDEVLVRSLNRKGHVIEMSGMHEVIVQLGIMKMKVERTDIELVSPKAVSKPVQPTGAAVQRTRDENVRMELDLRGSNLDDAIMEADRFLDESLLANLGQIYIIHGKGTGVLRSGIHDFLRRHRRVKSFRLGNYGEGGSGVTVVELQ